MDKCFADKVWGCQALEVKECNGCTFYKANDQYNKDRMTAKKKNDLKGILTGQAYIVEKRKEEK